MNRWFWAAAALLAGAAGTASADYIIIVANVGHTKEPPPMANQMGAPPGGSMAPPMGSIAPPMGSMAPPLGSSGPMGMPMGGISGGPPGMGAAGAPPEGQAINVAAVVEVEAPFTALLPHADPNNAQKMLPLPTKDRWGIVRLQNYKGVPLDLHFAPPQEAVLTVEKRIAAKYNAEFKDKSGAKPSADKILEVAEYALTHGRNDKPPETGHNFVEVMQKLGEDNPTNAAFVAFQKVQAELDKPATQDDSAVWQKRLGDNYKTATLTKGHYVLIHNLPSSDQDEVQERLTRLEDALHTFYYWFALRGVVLPAPAGRLPVLLTAQEPEFHHTRASLTDPAVVGDGFFARREGLTVFCARPLDPLYGMLDQAATPLLTAGNFVRQQLLSGKEYVGYPKGTPLPTLASAETLALLMKALEDESERAGVSHMASRQLLFAAGLLPRGVVAPEWVQFGMGSFFETPEESPWPSPAAPSTLYLPLYRQEMSDKGNKFEGDAFKTMRKIVTDGYFRELTPEEADTPSPERLKARTAAWSLTYFLAKRKLDNLQRYFKVLSDMPRDLELDDGVLWECFARSFDAYDPVTRRFDDAKLGQLAIQWQTFVSEEPLEAEELLNSLKKTLTALGIVENSRSLNPKANPRPAGSKANPQPQEPKENRPREIRKP